MRRIIKPILTAIIAVILLCNAALPARALNTNNIIEINARRKRGGGKKNYTTVTVMWSTDGGSRVSYHKYYRNRGGYFFTDMKKIKPGDVIGFYKYSGKKSYAHVALIVRVDYKNGTYVAYDSGHKFTTGRKHYWTGRMDTSPCKSFGHYKDYQVLRLGNNNLK